MFFDHDESINMHAGTACAVSDGILLTELEPCTPR